MFVAQFWYYPGIFLQELMKSMKNVSQDSQFARRYLNPVPPERKAGILLIR
jgi:hypothetical protein